MGLVSVKWLLWLTLTLAVVSCDRSPAAKFRPGDKVRTIMESEGIVCLRTRLFRDDVYFITISGGQCKKEWHSSRVEEWNYSRSTDAYSFEYSPDAYDSGPYDAADLRLVQNDER